jgi:hypothetical protein
MENSKSQIELVGRDAALKRIFLQLSEFSVEEWCFWLENFIAGKPSSPILPKDDEFPHTVVNDVFHHLLAPAQLRLREAVSRCFRSTQPADDPPTVLKLFTLLEIIAHIGVAGGLDAFYARLTGRLFLHFDYAGRNLHTLLLYTMGQPGPDEFLIRFIEQTAHEQKTDFNYLCACTLIMAKPGRGLSFRILKLLLPYLNAPEHLDGIADVVQEILFREGYEAFCAWYYDDTVRLAKQGLAHEMDTFESLLREELVPLPEETDQLSPYGVLFAYSLSIGKRRLSAQDIWKIACLPRESGAERKMEPFVETVLRRIWQVSRETNREIRPWYSSEESGIVEISTTCESGEPKEHHRVTFDLTLYRREFDLLSKTEQEELLRDTFDRDYRMLIGRPQKGVI